MLRILSVQNVERLDSMTMTGVQSMKNQNYWGWCDTNIGKMGVFECTCGQRYRFHCTVMTWTADDDEFDRYLYYKAKECTNWEEIKKQLG